MKMRFLLDEHMARRIIDAVHHRNPLIDMLRVGDPGSPPLGTLDPAILDYLDEKQRALITENRRSMMGHYGDHIAAGKTHWGVFVISGHVSIGKLAEEIEMLWETSEAEEWVDRWVNLPL